jgi:hypothetical protein
VDSSRDELEVAANRLSFWTMPEQEYDNWARLGGGAFGDIFQVDSVFPPLTVQGGEAPLSTVVVKAVVGADNAGAMDALRAEIKALCYLRHPNIVRVYGFSFTPRPVNEEEEEVAQELRSTVKDEDPEVLLGAARLSRQDSQNFGIHVPPKSLLSMRYHDCKVAGMQV